VSPRKRHRISHFDDDPGTGPLLEVENLTTYFPTDRGPAAPARPCSPAPS
jgi:hypothetical protein